MTNTGETTLSKVMVENKNKRKLDIENRLNEIEDILLELSFTDPEFQKLVSERNQLLSTQ